MSISSRTQGSTGNAYFKSQVSAHLSRLRRQIPDECRLSESYLVDPPLNVISIPETCGILTPKDLAITGLDATDILARIASGDLTAVEVVIAFGKRAAIAHQLTVCLTDFFLEEGIQRAKELDDYFKANSKTVSPLHGLPISIKVRVCCRMRFFIGRKCLITLRTRYLLKADGAREVFYPTLRYRRMIAPSRALYASLGLVRFYIASGCL